MFWQAKKTCKRCCDCQTPCVDPSIIGHANPVTQVAASRLESQNLVADSMQGLEADGNSTLLETMNYDAAFDSDIAADSRGISPTEDTLPMKLPTISDGELDFEPIESSERFEPLWITPTPEIGSSE